MEEFMITCNLMGGMGNQLFQWAASQAAAKIHDTECYYLAPYFLSQGSWKFSLHEFGLKPKINSKDKRNILIFVMISSF